MLEIKNVYRTYKPKKGVPVKALDGVSLSFADTGLVFILGKSGSGKSTLLNVIGGLDSADSGEFSIKGKSSKDFSQADFDSYRNTFIGFIFQEYNILNEFTVGQNIALAMKLQGKKVDDKSLNEILEEVDLVGYANRKPNELSGGQKQRVAIARALIKEPEIIMADEPTGALDSNTGKQVFDTLKKLSQTKLVIVVSHDREFAEYYGDRVIELADGKIISDITKETAQSRKESEGLSVVDDKILHIRKGYKLTKEDMDKIQQYLDQAQSDTIISMDERSNANFCQIARIDDEGNQEVFRDTDNGVLSEENKKYDGSSKFIRSKLPYSHAFKIGASSLKTKPFRLFMTIFLCFVSFAMFGLADTVGSYNKLNTTVNSIVDSNYDSVVFDAKIRNGEYYSTGNGGSLKDLERISEKTGIEFMGVASASDRFNVFDANKIMGANYSQYYQQAINGYLPAGEENFQKYGFGNFTGRQPVASNEIVITKYIYDQIALAGLVNSSWDGSQQTIKPSDFENEEEFLSLSPNIYLNNISGNTVKDKNWKIVGIIDTKADPTGRFDSLKPSESATNESITSYLLSSECDKYFKYGYHSFGYVSQQTYESILDGLINSTSDSMGAPLKGYFNFQTGSSYFSIDFSAVANDEVLDELEVLWLGDVQSSLADNEYIINIEQAENFSMFTRNPQIYEELEIIFNKTYFSGIVKADFSTVGDLSSAKNTLGIYEAASALTGEQIEEFRIFIKSYKEQYNEDVMNDFIIKMAYSADLSYVSGITCERDGMEENIDVMSHDELKFLYSGYLLNYHEFEIYDFETSDYINIPSGRRQNALGLDCGIVAGDYYGKKLYYPILFEAAEFSPLELKNVDQSISGGDYSKYEDGKIVGYYIQKGKIDEYGELSRYYDSVVVNNEFYKKAASFEPTVYSCFIAPMPKDKDAIQKLVELHYDENSDRGFYMQNGVTFLLDMVNDLLEVLGQVFLYIGIGLAIFSMLLMSNYIAVSISYKKREIGILRAVGAKSSDVFSIFFSESLVIALINFVIAALVCGVGCIFLNNMLRNEYGLQITLLNFGIRQVALMLAISVAVALISSFLPVYRLSRKKPIETIRTA